MRASSVAIISVARPGSHSYGSSAGLPKQDGRCRCSPAMGVVRDSALAPTNSIQHASHVSGSQCVSTENLLTAKTEKQKNSSSMRIVTPTYNVPSRATLRSTRPWLSRKSAQKRGRVLVHNPKSKLVIVHESRPMFGGRKHSRMPRRRMQRIGRVLHGGLIRPGCRAVVRDQM
mgnify:CR=1 FL=1